MDINDLASKLDRMNDVQMTGVKNQAILENEVKNISKTMEKFAEILTKQVEIETVQSAMREDINFAFEAIRKVQENGTNICAGHNTQFAEYHLQCTSKAEQYEKDIKILDDKIRVRDARFMKIATVIASPIYLYIITKILNI